jgi:hypothetical protein
MMKFQEWQAMEREKLAGRFRQLGKRKLTYIEQRLRDARLDCIRDGQAEYERFLVSEAEADYQAGLADDGYRHYLQRRGINEREHEREIGEWLDRQD